jgi:hypothetical protein
MRRACMQDTRAGAVTVLIALVAHKWVESIALSARCIKAGGNWWCARFFEGFRFSAARALDCIMHACHFLQPGRRADVGVHGQREVCSVWQPG